MDEKRLPNDISGCHARVERRVGVLEDDLRLSAQRFELGRRKGEDILAFKEDAARCRFFQAEHDSSCRRLAAAALSYKAEGFAGEEFERDAIDGL
jgi:hypothetical protein